MLNTCQNTSSNENKTNFIYFSNEKEKDNYRAKLYDIINDKLTIFEHCINEVGFSQPYPYLDLRYNFIGKYFKWKKIPQIYPSDKTEDLLVRNYVQNYFSKQVYQH